MIEPLSPERWGKEQSWNLFMCLRSILNARLLLGRYTCARETSSCFMNRFVLSVHDSKSALFYRMFLWISILHLLAKIVFFNETRPNAHHLNPQLFFEKEGVPPHFGQQVKKFLDITFKRRWLVDMDQMSDLL